MRSDRLNRPQRIVVVIGLGIGLVVFGDWATTRGGSGTGWVAYAPLSGAVNAANGPVPGLPPWVRLLMWLALIIVWVLVSIALLRTTSVGEDDDPAE